MTTSLKRQADVHGLPTPREGEAVYFDEGKPKDRVAGLGLRIRAGGSRKFVFLFRLGGRQLKYTIGDATAWTLDAARAEARRLRVQVDRGENPATVKQDRAKEAAQEQVTFAAIADQYLKRKERQMKPRSFVEVTRHLKKHWQPLNGLRLDNITRAMVASRLAVIADERGATTADHCRISLSTLFSWAIGEGIADTNPVIGTNRQGGYKPRDRVLTDAELVKIWQAAPDSDFGRIVKLLMLTGQRRDEIGGLGWSEIDVDNKLIALPGERVKNHRAHEVPLSDMALDVLFGQHRRLGRERVFGESGFAGWGKAKERIDAAVKLKPWRLHDLRRTAATRMADLGVQPHVIEAVLNHISGHKAGVAGIYNRSTYAAEKRAALDLWANHLKVELAQAAGANVRRLQGTKRERA